MLSKPAELIQKLAALQKSDPAAFKQVTGRVAEHFEQLATFAQGCERDSLSQLARSFASAAQSGDMSAFQPVSSEPVETPPAPAPAAPEAPPPVDAVATGLSLVAELTSSDASEGASDPLQKLTQLKSSDRAGFKQLMNRVAERLDQLANFSAAGDRALLSETASRFASAAESGDLSAFQPAPSEPVEAPPAPAPTPPAAAPPIDAVATGLSFVAELRSSDASDGASDPLQQLTQLRSSDRAGFKQLMNRVAERLDQLANFSDAGDRALLSETAGRFASAAESGDLSAFQPASSAPVETPPVDQAPAPLAPPPVSDEQAPPISACERWRSGHVYASYRQQQGAPSLAESMNAAFASAVSLVDSLTNTGSS